MNTGETWQRLTEVFQETLGDPEVVIERDTTADDIEDWDSVSNIQLLVAIENVFEVKFRTGDIAGLKNVGELYDLITGHERR